MKNTKTSILVPIIWLFATGCWVATLGVDLYYQESPTYLIVLHIFCLISSLIAAIINYGRYKTSCKVSDAN